MRSSLPVSGSDSFGTRWLAVLGLCALSGCTESAAQRGDAGPLPDGGVLRTYQNPLFTGGDPALTYAEGRYHLVSGGPDNLVLRSSETLTGLASATPVEVWRDGRDGSPCCYWWAPEIWFFEGRYYIYAAASTVLEPVFVPGQRIVVISADEPEGPYTYRGQIDTDDLWAIDASILDLGPTERYLLYSGRLERSSIDLDQHIFIRRLLDPVTAAPGPSVLISSPDQEWERRYGSNPLPIHINEGPEALIRGELVHIVYSASYSKSDFYCLGALTMRRGDDPLDPASWTKSDGCLFESNPEIPAYSPGHNFMLPSPDGTEWINLYHANPVAGAGWSGRTVRMQAFGWDTNGYPVFGHPVSYDAVLPVPSGEPGRTRWSVEAEVGVMHPDADVIWAREASSEQAVRLDAGETVTMSRVVEGGERYALRYRSEAGGSVELSPGTNRITLPASTSFTWIEWDQGGRPSAPFTVTSTGGPVEIDAIEAR